MRLNRTTSLRLIRLASAVLVVAIICAYAISRSFSYARGPAIHIFEPVNGAAIASSSVLIRGRADRINSLSLNGSPLSVDQQGGFSATTVIFKGINLITLSANDQFGRSTHAELQIFGTSDFPEPPADVSASSTTDTNGVQ